jgi:hypothetical protein
MAFRDKRHWTVGLAGLALGAGALAANAPPPSRGLFVCLDANGKRITSDRPPPECATREIRELNPDGSLKRIIGPPLTAEQRAARAAEEQRKKEEAERAAEQRRNDRALLETYSSVEQIERARGRALAGRRLEVERAQRRKTELVEQSKKLDKEAEFYAKRELPDKLKRAYAELEGKQQTEDRIIADAQADMKRIDESYTADAKRYRELVADGLAKPADPAK